VTKFEVALEALVTEAIKYIPDAYDKYDNERSVEIKLEVIKRFMAESEVIKFVAENLGCSAKG